jgi:hypothetical protein
MYNSTMMKKAWHIEGYTMQGAVYCRDCVAETLNDDSFCDPYVLDESQPFTPIFASDVETEELEEMYCEHCFHSLA